MCHESNPLAELQLDFADLDGSVVLPVASLNLVLVGLLVLQNGKFLCAALLHDLARDSSFARIGSCQHLFVVGMYGQHGSKLHLLAHIALHPLDADGVSRRDTILLSPGLYDGVHLSSKRLRQTTIILGSLTHRQRTVFQAILANTRALSRASARPVVRPRLQRVANRSP